MSVCWSLHSLTHSAETVPSEEAVVPEIQILSCTAYHLVREKAEYRLVPEWLPKVLGEEDPSTSVWAGRTDGALPSGDRKGRYCCADMTVVS